MAQVYLSLGSNIEPVRHLRAALADLEARYGTLQVSSAYESPAFGFTGDHFYNLAVGLRSQASPELIQRSLQEIEKNHGRTRGEQKFSARTLDIDLLLYDDLCLESAGLRLPRDEILKYAFVLCPLAEIAPDARHPRTGQRYAALWAAFDQVAQPLWKASAW